MTWLKTTEYGSIAASVLGTVVAAATQQTVYAAAPLTLALSVNFLNRQRLDTQSDQTRQEIITQVKNIVQTLSSLPTHSDLTSSFQSIKQEIQNLEKIAFNFQEEFNNRLEPVVIIAIQNQLEQLKQEVQDKSKVSLRQGEEIKQLNQEIKCLINHYDLDRFDNSLQNLSATNINIIQEIEQIKTETKNLASQEVFGQIKATLEFLAQPSLDRKIVVKQLQKENLEKLATKGVENQVRNLIFASNGLKPEIVLSDSISNEIQIVKNQEYCLVYNRPINSHGLLWKELVDWWRTLNNQEHIDDRTSSQALYSRLLQSLGDNQCEKLLFRTYFKKFHDNILAEKLPALIPQIYLHYDPYTIKQLNGKKRLPRQRMDFLLLFSNSVRVIIEVDGKQHYAEGNTASPKLYAALVSEDRKLKLAGYEVYRFGGYELKQENAEEFIKDFFLALFKRHKII